MSFQQPRRSKAAGLAEEAGGILGFLQDTAVRETPVLATRSCLAPRSAGARRSC
ncbi:MAG: hypothetical protein ACR2OE_12160 [Thermomicrobiales bacterium]